MITISDLIRIKFNLECIGIRDDNSLYRTDGITCDDIENYCAVETTTGMFAFHADHILSIISEIRREMWYYISEIKHDFPDCIELGNTEETFETFVVYDRDLIVSKAWSIRLNNEAAEVAVETLESHRGRGYGKQVVSAWAKSQRDRNKIPIYAHRTGNDASMMLAQSLGSIKFADVTSYH